MGFGGGGVDGPPEKKPILIEIYVPKLPINMPQPPPPRPPLDKLNIPRTPPKQWRRQRIKKLGAGGGARRKQKKGVRGILCLT